MQLPTIPCSASVRMTRTPLGVDFCPDKYSVLCGRGKICSTSSGNRRLNNMVKHFVKPYSAAKTKFEKSNIVSAIIATIRQACPGAGFVKFEEGEWWEVDDGFAREKIGCLFRDCLHTRYRSSTKAKIARRKAKASRERSIASPAMTGMPNFPAPLCPVTRQVSHADSCSNNMSMPMKFPSLLPSAPRQVSHESCLSSTTTTVPTTMSMSNKKFPIPLRWAPRQVSFEPLAEDVPSSCSPPVMSIDIPVARSLIQDDLFSEVQSYRPTRTEFIVGDCTSPMVVGSSAQVPKNNTTMIWSALDEACEMIRDYVDDDDMLSVGSPDDISEIGEVSAFLEVVLS
jgi:hypothetical protein